MVRLSPFSKIYFLGFMALGGGGSRWASGGRILMKKKIAKKNLKKTHKTLVLCSKMRMVDNAVRVVRQGVFLWYRFCGCLQKVL